MKGLFQKLRQFRLLPAALLIAAVAFSGCQTGDDSPEDIGAPTWPDRVPGKLDFKKHVRPILVVNCIECHNAESAAKNANLDLQTREVVFNRNPPVIVPGNPDESLLIQVLKRNPAHEWAMPPTPDRIWGVRMDILRKWIREGAVWPDGVVLEHPADVVEW